MKHINLLPKHKQTELYYEDLYHSTLVAVIIGVVVLLLGIVAQIFVMVYLNSTESRVSAEVETLKQQTDKTENAELKKQIRLINNQMVDFEKLAANSPKWSRVVSSFAKLVPRGVKINSFKADSKTGKVDITGFSPTRESVIELYNNINSDKEHFKDINYPLENVSKPTDVQFNFTFYIVEGVLMPKPEPVPVDPAAVPAAPAAVPAE
ncbi:PilN domain-containing protein [bacterium]|nr:MAG: PilN domain-containing protein [bacterium]